MSIVRIKEYLQKNEYKIVLFVGFLLVSGLSFEVGMLWGQKWQQQPLIIEKQIGATITTETPFVANFEVSESISTVKPQAKKQESSIANCIYVGSKNSKKFYLASCSWAKRIKPENLVCFSTQDEAIKQGRTESICSK